jgi:hypothetical protein
VACAGDIGLLGFMRCVARMLICLELLYQL